MHTRGLMWSLEINSFGERDIEPWHAKSEVWQTLQHRHPCLPDRDRSLAAPTWVICAALVPAMACVYSM